MLLMHGLAFALALILGGGTNILVFNGIALKR